MDQPRSTTLVALPDVPTLDPERIDHVGVFLTIEAAADVAAPAPRRAPRGGFPVRRRAVGGIAAALVLGGALFAVNGIVGGPGPAAVPAAVAIEHVDGWTTIEILDPQASPAQIEAALDAAGIDARVEVDHSGQTGGVRFAAFGSEAYSVVTYGSVAPGALSGMEVEFGPGAEVVLPASEPSEAQDVATKEAELKAWHEAYRASLEPIGVRIGDGNDTVVSIRDGADVAIVLFTPA